MDKPISILLINPWIYDFAAYNLWSEPLGLLNIAGILKELDIEINIIDCLRSNFIENPKSKENGCSKFIRTVIPKPDVLNFVPRNYAVYGIYEEEFMDNLKKTNKPDVILVTSAMTYWYPGVFKVIQILKKYYKNVPVILGGIYATLCKEHAEKNSGADFVLLGSNIFELLKLIKDITGKNIKLKFPIQGFRDYPIPPHQLLPQKNFFAVLTRRGCPFRCNYCASYVLYSQMETRSTNSVIEEIKTYTKLLNTRNIAFYDDALLYDAENHIIPILEEIAESNINLSFHLPNAIHSRFLSKKISELLWQTGFKTIRLGLETSIKDIQIATGNKVSNYDYVKSIDFLTAAGFKNKDIGTYILIGLPGQKPEDVEKTLIFVQKTGGTPYLSFYSPIPKTPMFEIARRMVKLDIENEPLFHNNTVFILKHPDFSESAIKYLKDMAKTIRDNIK